MQVYAQILHELRHLVDYFQFVPRLSGVDEGGYLKCILHILTYLNLQSFFTIG